MLVRVCGLYVCVRCRKHESGKTELPSNPAASLLRLSSVPQPILAFKASFDVMLSSYINTKHAYCSTGPVTGQLNSLVSREALLGFKLPGLEICLALLASPPTTTPAGHLIDTHSRSYDPPFLYTHTLIKGYQAKPNSSHGGLWACAGRAQGPPAPADGCQGRKGGHQ